jgi:hypothetical protein
MSDDQLRAAILSSMREARALGFDIDMADEPSIH